MKRMMRRRASGRKERMMRMKTRMMKVWAFVYCCAWYGCLCPAVFLGDVVARFGKSMESVFLKILGRSPKELAHVDMTQRMTELDLLGNIPPDSWPQPNAVRELVTKVKKLRKAGVQKPFVNADLRK